MTTWPRLALLGSVLGCNPSASEGGHGGAVTASAVPPRPAATASAADVEPRCKPAPDDLPAGAPSRMSIYRQLLQRAATPLSEGEHCEGVVATPEPIDAPTLGDWLAYNLSVLTEAEAISLPVSCRRAEAGWTCTVEFSACHSKTNLFWNWGVKIHLDAEGKLGPDFACIGAG